MIDPTDDDLEEQTPDDVREALELELRTTGARAAYDALLAVCKDSRAPAPARATAGTSILRAAGMFNRADGEGSSKAPHEMTGAELAAEIGKLRRKRRRLSAPAEDDDSSDKGVFN